MKLRQMLSRMALLATILVARTAIAATYTWTGAGANGNFTNPANWLDGLVPPSDGTATIVFANINHGPTALLDASFDIGAVTFSGVLPSTSTYGTLGSALTLEGGLTVSTTNSPTINVTLPTVLAADQTWAINNGKVQASGIISGFAQLTKTGSGQLNLSGVNVYTGGTVLSGGTLGLGSVAALGTGTLTINSGTLSALNTLALANAVSVVGNFTDSGSALTLAGPVSLLLTPTITISGTSLLTISGQISGAQGLIAAGTGTLFLSGTNSYTGPTVSTAGEIIFLNAASVPLGANLLKATGSGYIGSEVTTGVQAGFINNFDKANTTGLLGFDSPNVNTPLTFAEAIDLTGFNAAAQLGTSTAAVLAGTITPQGLTYLFGGTGKLTVSSTLTDSASARNVVVNDDLKLVLTGANTYSGTTTATNGSIVFAGTGALPTGAGALTAATNGYIGYTSATGLTAAAFLAKFNGAATTGIVGFDSTTTDNIDLTGFSSSATIGSSTSGVTLSGTITPVGSTYRFATVRSGTLIISSILSGARVAVFGTTDSTSSVTLTGANSYTGGTTLQSGTLVIGNVGALGTGNIIANNGTTLRVGITGVVTTANLSIASGSFTYNTQNFASEIDGIISGAGRALFAGTGVIDIYSANTLTGGFVLEGGQVNLNNNLAVGPGVLDFGSSSANANFTTSVPIIYGLDNGSSSAVVNLAPSAVLTIDESNASRAAFLGSIHGSNVIVIKTGTGLTTFSGTSTYSGTTSINAGSMLADNNAAFGTSSVVVNGGSLAVSSGVTVSNPVAVSSGSLTGYGAFGTPGGITVGSGAIIAPGTATNAFRLGLLSFSTGLTFASGGTFQFEVQDSAAGAGVGYDSLAVTGTMNFTATLGSPFTLSLTSLNASGAAGALATFDNTNSYSWTLATAGSFTGFNASAITINSSGFTNALGGGTFSTSVSGGNLLLNFSPVPEPSTWALLAVGLASLAVTRRRSSNAKRASDRRG